MLLDSNVIIYSALAEFDFLLDFIRVNSPLVSAISKVEADFKGYDLLTELRDVSAAQKVELPCQSVTTLTGMSRWACRGGRDLDLNATESDIRC